MSRYSFPLSRQGNLRERQKPRSAHHAGEAASDISPRAGSNDSTIATQISDFVGNGTGGSCSRSRRRSVSLHWNIPRSGMSLGCGRCLWKESVRDLDFEDVWSYLQGRDPPSTTDRPVRELPSPLEFGVVRGGNPAGSRPEKLAPDIRSLADFAMSRLRFQRLAGRHQAVAGRSGQGCDCAPQVDDSPFENLISICLRSSGRASLAYSKGNAATRA